VCKGARNSFFIMSTNLESIPVLLNDQDVVRAVKHLAHTTCFSSLQLEDLAQHLGISKKRVSNAFRRLLGISAAAYLRNERMLLAQRLLIQTSLATEQIATRAGFSNSANFSNAFRKHFGLSPSAYRQRAPLEAITLLQGSVPWALGKSEQE
jgi:transcriptional regulator GlxA family with amidase domain